MISYIIDGLFLWMLPYVAIVPGLTIYFLIQNFNNLSSKISSFLISILVLYFLIIFFSITPYQYTYLNFFNGSKENRYTKFENDYWGASLNRLIQKTTFKKDEKLKFSTCGVNEEILNSLLLKKGYNNYKIVNVENSSYIIMTNRVTVEYENGKDLKLTNCFDKFAGDDYFMIKKNNLPLSIVRKIN